MPGASGVRGGARSGAMSRAGSRARCASTLVMVFVAVAVAPRACAAANAWKAAENKLRQEGLLVDDAGLPDDGESAAAVEAGPAERVSPAEEKFRAARDILSEFTTRHRRNARAVGWLREALALDPNHREAMTLLGRAYQMGEGVEPDEALAMEHFRRAADLGDPGAHFELGFAYSVGWGGVEKNTALAVLHQYFAAFGGDARGQMAMAHRHLRGAGVPASCRAAVLYYEPAADTVVSSARFPGGAPHVEKVRLTAETEGGAHARRERDVVQYYLYSADLGNADAASAVGQLLNAGARGMTKDHARAYRYFTQAAAAGDVDAMSHLGHMHANGLGVKPNNASALALFARAAEKGNSHAQYGLGYMHLAGFGVPQNHDEAVKYFHLAAEQGSADAQFHLGALHARGVGVAKDHAKAFYNFNLAAHQGHATAIYNLAMMQLAGMGLPQSCRNAAGLLKGLAERGPWNRPLENARRAVKHKSYRAGLMRYMKAAETGVEVAQANAAYVLERGDAWYEGEEGDRLRRMLHYHGLAADQGNVKSLLQIGDAYYYGKGVDAPDKNKSAAVYLQASQHRSAQAMFNLGMMHEHGVGLPKDLHLAKRYYDMVLSTDPKATVPVRLALWKLAAHGWLLARGGPLLERARLAYDAGGLGENATTADIAETVSLVFFGAALAIVLVARALATATARRRG